MSSLLSCTPIQTRCFPDQAATAAISIKSVLQKLNVIHRWQFFTV